MDSENEQLLFHIEMWLSLGNVLKMFFCIKRKIGLFMAMKEKLILLLYLTLHFSLIGQTI